MKVDTSRLKRGTSEVPIECQQLIDRLSNCSRAELIQELSKIESWTFGKCELYHWITILDKFDQILEEATQIYQKSGDKTCNKNNVSDGDNCNINDDEIEEWNLKCDTNFSSEDVKLLLLVLNFTTLLIEHSFSRHLYNSIEHLTKLLSSRNMNIVLGVLNLLYMFSKRSNFISRLTNNKKNSLLARLNFFAESWGGKEYGFSLAACCEKTELPSTASTLFYEFYSSNGTSKTIEYEDVTKAFIDENIKNVDDLAKLMFQAHKEDIKNLDEDQRMHILIRIRRAWAFRNHAERLHFVQARLQALSVLIYSNSVQENIHQLLYPGFLEELVELLGLMSPNLVEIKAAGLRTLTSIIHLDRNPHFPKKPGSRLAMIIDVTGASSYHGFLPTLVRTCINSLTSFNSSIGGQFQQLRLNHHQNTFSDNGDSTGGNGNGITGSNGSNSSSVKNFTSNSNSGNLYLKNYICEQNFPLPLATALFSFLYHLASYESGGEALVSCGMMESLLRIINWNGYELEHITFVTRAVRVIDLITNIEMNSFQNHGGLESFINRLDLEVNSCRQEQPFEIEPQNHSSHNTGAIMNDINDFTGFFQNSNSSNDSNFDQIGAATSSATTSFTNILTSNDLELSNEIASPAFRLLPQLRNQGHDDVIIIDDSTTEDSQSPVRHFTHNRCEQDCSNQQQSQQLPNKNQQQDHQRLAFACLQFGQRNQTNATTTKTCLPQRAALLKSMLNFLKKAIQDQAFSDSIRHLMEGSLPSSLRHIISNAEYYGPSLFLLATDVVTVYVFQEPSLLSSLQDNGLTDVVLQALLKKDVPATREVLGSLPNVFSALCLNSRGLHAFVKYAPFERLYKVLLSPIYLLAMRRRRSNEPMGDTASNLGNAMDELMRHQPSLKAVATKAIIKLLNELVILGTDPRYVCWRLTSKNDTQSFISVSGGTGIGTGSNVPGTSSTHSFSSNNDVNNPQIGSTTGGGNSVTTALLRQQHTQQAVQQLQHRPTSASIVVGTGTGGSTVVVGTGGGTISVNTNTNDAEMSDGDEEDDDEEEASTSSHHNQRDERTDSVSNQSPVTTNHHHQPLMNQNNPDEVMITDDEQCNVTEQRELVPLIDYIINAMKFIDAILSNNSTDDHCREFVQQGGLQPLLSILALPNLPVDSPVTTSAQAVAAVCKSILNLSHEPEVLQVALNQLSSIVNKLEPLQIHIVNPGGSVLLRELANCPNVDAAFSNAQYTPLLHAMNAVHGYIVMLVHICRTGQSEIRNILLEKWGQRNDLLTKLVQLYTALVWESTLLLALCTDDVFPAECDFGKEDIEKLPNDNQNEQLSNQQQHNQHQQQQSRLDDDDEEDEDDCIIVEENTKNIQTMECDGEKYSISGVTNQQTAGGNQQEQSSTNSGEKEKKLIASPSRLRYIKALLGASSRLGRALAELFGNLVKLCVGSPLRQRRGQNYPPTPAYTSEEAKDIARVLSYILVDGFSYEKLSPSPIPKLKLTFLICSVGFTGPMLFDEKRYAFHLMLYQFVKEGGLKAFFEMFEWALMSAGGGGGDSIDETVQPDDNRNKTNDTTSIPFKNRKFPDGTGEFLDAWLMLLEKMVNPKAILESPHVINPGSGGGTTTSATIQSQSHYSTAAAAAAAAAVAASNRMNASTSQNNDSMVGGTSYHTHHHHHHHHHHRQFSTQNQRAHYVDCGAGSAYNKDNKPSHKSNKKFEFDPVLYLVTIHRLAFDAVLKIWGMKPLKLYGMRMTESMMSILKHIIKSEKMIKEKYKKRISEIREINLIAKLHRNATDFTAGLKSVNIGLGENLNNSNDTYSSHVSSMSTQTGISHSSLIANNEGTSGATSSAVNNQLDSVFNRICPQHQQQQQTDVRNSSNLDANSGSISGNMVVNPEHLRQLIDMGFSEEHATTALLLTASVQDATEYLLNHPPSPPPPPSWQSLQTVQQPEYQVPTTSETTQQRRNTTTRSGAEPMDVSDQETSPKPEQQNKTENTKKSNKSDSASGNIHKENKKYKKKKCFITSSGNANDGNIKASTKSQLKQQKRKYQISTNPPLQASKIDEFCDTAIEKTIYLMDELPETVSKGTDLLVILYRRNRLQWRRYFLMKIVKELNAWIDFIRKQIRLGDSNIRVMLYGEGAQKFYVRLQLCCLLMDDIYPDMRESICQTINEQYTLSKLLCLLSEIEELLRVKTIELRAQASDKMKNNLTTSIGNINDAAMITEDCEHINAGGDGIFLVQNQNKNLSGIPVTGSANTTGNCTVTSASATSATTKKDIKMLKPQWLAQMITFIDLVEKVNLAIQRKRNMLNVTTRTWKWYDINLGRWNVYSAANNKIIDQAYEDGEASVPITSGRQRYTINFNCMSQVNDESGNHRPVILALKAFEKFSPHSHSQQQQQQQSQNSTITPTTTVSISQQQTQQAVFPTTSTVSGADATGATPASNPAASTSTATASGSVRRCPGQIYLPTTGAAVTTAATNISSLNTTNAQSATATAPGANESSTPIETGRGNLSFFFSSDDSECYDLEDSDDISESNSETQDSDDENSSNYVDNDEDHFFSEEYDINAQKMSNFDINGKNKIKKHKQQFSLSKYDLNNLKITPPSAENIYDDDSPPLPGRQRIYNPPKPEESAQTAGTSSDIKIDNSPVGLFQYDTGEIVSCLVRLLQPEIDVDRDTFLAIMKLCVRLTKNFENAKIFAQQGGVRLLLEMRQTSGYMGFPIFATLLIRHVLEEPKTLALAMEKVIAARTMPTIPPGYRDLLFLLRQMSSAVSRDPEIFREVAQKMLRIDLMNTRLVKPDDTRFLVKSILPSSIATTASSIINQTNNAPVPSTSAGTSSATSAPQPSTSGINNAGNTNLKKVLESHQIMEPISIEAVHDLLKALVQPVNFETKCTVQQHLNAMNSLNSVNPSANQTNATGITRVLPNRRNISGAAHLFYNSPQTTVNVTESTIDTSSTNIDNQQQQNELNQSHLPNETKLDANNHVCNEKCKIWHMPTTTDKPLLPRATILKFLADAVRSYQTFAPLIVQYQYTPNDSVLIKQPQSVLSFILDNFLPLSEHTIDREVSSMSRVLIAALASCSDQINVQTMVVCEVKAAINRVLLQPESIDKHSHLQILGALIPTMIENCPPENNTLLKLHQMQPRRNEIFYIMVRKGLISDLAKLTQYLDLSSPHTIGTVNATLKPLENLLRMTNAPGPISYFPKKTFSRRLFYNNDEEDHHHGVTRSANLMSEDLNDVDSNDRPGVTNNSNSGVGSNSHHHHILADQNDIISNNVEELQVVAENLSRPQERTQAHLDDIMDQLLEHASNIENDPSQMVNGNHNPATVRRVMHEFFDESSTDSGDTDSNGSDNDEREMDEDEENEEEAEDRSEIDVDEETRQFIEIYDHVYNRHLSPEGSGNTNDQMNQQSVQNEATESNSSDVVIDNEQILHRETSNNTESAEGGNSNNSITTTPSTMQQIGNETTRRALVHETIEDGNESTSSESVFYTRVQNSQNENQQLSTTSATLQSQNITIDDFDDILSIDSTDITRPSSTQQSHQQSNTTALLSTNSNASQHINFAQRHHSEAVAESVVADVVANVVAAIENSGELDMLPSSANAHLDNVSGASGGGSSRALINIQTSGAGSSSHSSQISHNIRRRRRRPIQFSFAINSPLSPMSDFMNLRRRRYTILNDNVDHTPIILQQLLGPSSRSGGSGSGGGTGSNASGGVSISNVGRSISISANVGNNDANAVVANSSSGQSPPTASGLLSQFNLNPFNTENGGDNHNQNENGNIENEVRRNSNSNTSNIFRDATRVVLMDNAFGIFPDEHFPDDRSIDLVDQAGYLFGQTLAATLASTPTALHWWLEESKNLGLESQSDVCLTVAHQLIPSLEEQREVELAKIRSKKKRKEELKSSGASTAATATSDNQRTENNTGGTSTTSDTLQHGTIASTSFQHQPSGNQLSRFNSNNTNSGDNTSQSGRQQRSQINSSNSDNLYDIPPPLLRAQDRNTVIISANTNNSSSGDNTVTPVRLFQETMNNTSAQRTLRNRVWLLNRPTGNDNGSENVFATTAEVEFYGGNNADMQNASGMPIARRRQQSQQQPGMEDNLQRQQLSSLHNIQHDMDMSVVSPYSNAQIDTTRQRNTNSTTLPTVMPRLVPISSSYSSSGRGAQIDHHGDEEVEIIDDMMVGDDNDDDDEDDDDDDDEEEQDDDDEIDETDADDDEVVDETEVNTGEIHIVHNSASETEESSEAEILIPPRDMNAIPERTAAAETTAPVASNNVPAATSNTESDPSALANAPSHESTNQTEVNAGSNSIYTLDELLEIIDRNFPGNEVRHPSGRLFVHSPSELNTQSTNATSVSTQPSASGSVAPTESEQKTSDENSPENNLPKVEGKDESNVILIEDSSQSQNNLTIFAEEESSHQQQLNQSDPLSENRTIEPNKTCDNSAVVPSNIENITEQSTSTSVSNQKEESNEPSATTSVSESREAPAATSSGRNRENTVATSEITTEEAQEIPAGNTSDTSATTSVTAVASTTNSNAIPEMSPEVREALGDLEVPEGVDPSFLAALPQEMREEVIAEHLRLQRLRQRAQQISIQIEHAAVAEVNPEFLAALPPNIQEEVLAQQRIEQQRQAAATANPNDPVDAAAFFQNLPPNLRQAILTDMEDSQISVLPPELAAEAQNLRRDWENRNRQIMHERLINHIGSNSPSTSSVLSLYRNPRFPLQIHRIPQNWQTGGSGNDGRLNIHHHSGNNVGSINLTNGQGGGVDSMNSSPSLMTIMERQGKPLLDHEALASLLILLFIDDPKFNTLRLHRVIRNLCCHVPTREWIINALLSVIVKTNESHYIGALLKEKSQIKPHWLNIRSDAALGSRANVFTIEDSKLYDELFHTTNSNKASNRNIKNKKQNFVEFLIAAQDNSEEVNEALLLFQNLRKNFNHSKKYDHQEQIQIEIDRFEIGIHPQAAQIVCKHALELLITLAKSFPKNFLPYRNSTVCTNAIQQQSQRSDNQQSTHQQLSTASTSTTDPTNLISTVKNQPQSVNQTQTNTTAKSVKLMIINKNNITLANPTGNMNYNFYDSTVPNVLRLKRNVKSNAYLALVSIQIDTDFWEIILNLDRNNPNLIKSTAITVTNTLQAGSTATTISSSSSDTLTKLQQRSLTHNSPASINTTATSTKSLISTKKDGKENVSFDQSPFGTLVSMLSYRIINKSSHLTDKLLRLLSFISVVLPDTHTQQQQQSNSNQSQSNVNSSVNQQSNNISSNNVGQQQTENTTNQQQQQQESISPNSNKQISDTKITVCGNEQQKSQSMNDQTITITQEQFEKLHKYCIYHNNFNISKYNIKREYLNNYIMQHSHVKDSSTPNGTGKISPINNQSLFNISNDEKCVGDFYDTFLPRPERLALIIETLIDKNCSEEGLEDATSLLLNLSQCCRDTRSIIFRLLVDAANILGRRVGGQILELLNDLKQMNIMQVQQTAINTTQQQRLESGIGQEQDNFQNPQPSTSSGVNITTSSSVGGAKPKGMLQDRFTRETVVITAPITSRTKQTTELQLPSMIPLISKTSSQAIFLRSLKTIIQIRENVIDEYNKIIENLISNKTKSQNNENTNTVPGTTATATSESNNTTTVEQSSSNDTSVTNDVNTNKKVEDTSDQSKFINFNQQSLDELMSPYTYEMLPLSTLLELENLWSTLSNCLIELELSADYHAVLVLQSAVEAFFLVHATPQKKIKQLNPDADAVTISGQQQSQSSVNLAASTSTSTRQSNNSNQQTSKQTVQPMETDDIDTQTQLTQSNANRLNIIDIDQRKFLQFAEKHRTVLNQILRQSTVHLSDGPFAVLVDHTRILDFDVKRRYFRTELERLDEGIRREEIAVHVNRKTVFEDSFRELYRRNAEEWKNRFYIVFEDEEGQDAGGLLREWYVIISREIFNPMYALFTVSPGDRVTYMINSSSHANPNHLCYYKFVGRVIAKAIYDNKLLECYFTRSFYKHILGIQVKYTDMESEDYEFYKSLIFLLENEVAALGYDLTFSLEVQEFGVTEIKDLIPNGRNVFVTDDNKLEYIRLVCQLKMSNAIKQQLNAFLEGFYDIIPKRLISIFNEQELELLISGLPNVDIEDLRANTEYHKYQSNSIQIQWFWRALRSFDQAERAKFLQFVTGTSKVPLNGFGSLEGMNGIQKLQIHRDDRSTDRLPSAHTCFNQLDLPVYKTYDKLRSSLLKAIHECSEGFGFA